MRKVNQRCKPNRLCYALLSIVIAQLGVLTPISIGEARADGQDNEYILTIIHDMGKGKQTWGFRSQGAASYVAFRLNRDGTPFDNTYLQRDNSTWGEGHRWKVIANRCFLPLTTTPKKGAVAWWQNGHVAYVEQVRGNQAVVAEYAFNNQGFTRRTTQADAYIEISGPWNLTAADLAQLKEIRDDSARIIGDKIPGVSDALKMTQTYNAAVTLLQPSSTSKPGDALIKWAAMIDLWNAWTPESTIDAVGPSIAGVYSEMLKSVANELNSISSNIEKTDRRGGIMLHGIDDLKILIATLEDKRATSVVSFPDSLITDYVVKWYAENEDQLRTEVDNRGPRTEKKWHGVTIDRIALKSWFFENRTGVKQFRYGKAVVPPDLSYFNHSQKL